jgi:hypothetical protein
MLHEGVCEAQQYNRAHPRKMLHRCFSSLLVGQMAATNQLVIHVRGRDHRRPQLPGMGYEYLLSH